MERNEEVQSEEIQNEEIQNEEIQNEKVQNAVTETGRSKKKLLIILISAAAVVLIAAAVFAIVKLNTKNNSDKNELISEQTDPEKDKDETNDETDDTDGSTAGEGENTEDGKEDTDDKQADDTSEDDASTAESATIEQYIADGYTEFDISSIDVNSEMVNWDEKSGNPNNVWDYLYDFTDMDSYSVIEDLRHIDPFSSDGISKTKVGENNYTVNFPTITDVHGKEYEELNIENVKKIYSLHNEVEHEYFILSNDNVLINVCYDVYGSFDNSREAKYYNLEYDYKELFYLYSDDWNRTLVGLTESGEYKYVYSGCDFYEDWYYQKENFEILNNRNIYINGINYDSKCLMAFMVYPYVFENCPVYYIIDDKMRLLDISGDSENDYTGKVVSTVLCRTVDTGSAWDEYRYASEYALFDSDGKLIIDGLYQWYVD